MGVNHHRIAGASRPQKIHAGPLWTCLLGGWIGLAHAGPGATGVPRPPSAAQVHSALPSQPQEAPRFPDCDQVLTQQLDQHDPHEPRQGPTCSAANVTRLVKQFPRSIVPPGSVSQPEQDMLQRDSDLKHNQALLACLRKYVEKTQCAEAACQMATLLRKQAELKGDPNSPPAFTKEQLDYGTLCLSCVGSSPATKSQRTLIEEWSVAPKRLKNDLYYGLGGTLLGLGGASLAAGLAMIPFDNQPNGSMACMTGGQPVECVNRLGWPIGLSIVLGATAAGVGGYFIHRGCRACQRFQEKAIVPTFGAGTTGGPK